MKKLMSVLLALALVLAMVPVAASAADGDTSEDTWFIMQDFAEWGDDHPSWVNVGWQYPDSFTTDNINAIEVGIEDAEGNLIMKYTADTATVGEGGTDVNSDSKNQITWQQENSYIDDTTKQSSAPFGQSTLISDNGELLETVVGADWTVTRGTPEVFFAWEPAKAYVKVTIVGGESQVQVNDSFTSDGISSAYVAQVGNKYYETLDKAIESATSDSTITLLEDITADDGKVTGAGTAVYTIPDGVTLNGDGHTITASADWKSNERHPILGVVGSTATIENLTIVGNENSGHGINVWSAEGTEVENQANVTIENVTVQNCGTAGVVITTGVVNASGLKTSGSAWGAVNVDNGGSFTLTGTGNNFEESVQVYTEKPDSCNINVEAANLKEVKSYNSGEGSVLKGYTYYTSDVSKLGEATITTGEGATVYEKVEDAIEQATEGETVTLTKDVTVEDTITIGEGVTLDGNGKTITYAGEKKETNPSVLILANSGADNVTVKNVTLDTNGNLKHGVEFFAADNGKLSGVTVNGGSGTSVQVNGSTGFKIENCALNPGDGAYANIEYCLSESAQNAGGTTPSMTIENVTFDSASLAVWADATTVEKIKEELKKAGVEDPTVADVKNAISENVTTENSDSVTITVGLKGNTTDTITKPSTKPSTPGGTPTEPEEPTWPFTDVTEGDDWFYDAVAYVYENGIMAGTDETTFEPTMELDRAMAAQLFYNLEGKPTVTGDSTFTDVTSGHWAVDAITWAAQNDIVAGIGGGLYDPDSNVTREQFAVMLYKYAKYKGYDLTATGDLTQFPDAGSISSWAETALSWANGNGLINGHENGTIDPKGSTIRAQAASIMANFDQNVAK